MKAWRLLGEYDAETKSISAFAGTANGSLTAGQFTPDFNGTLVGLRATPGRSAATSLINTLHFKLTCSKWTPNSIDIGCVGSGLQTVPALQDTKMDWEVNQPCTAGVPIKLEGENLTADTPVTVVAHVWGLFDVAGN